MLPKVLLLLPCVPAAAPTLPRLLPIPVRPARTDNLGGSALMEAAKGSRDAILDRLVEAGGKLTLNRIVLAAHL